MRNSNENETFILNAVVYPAKKYENEQKRNSDLVIDANKNKEEIFSEIKKLFVIF